MASNSEEIDVRGEVVDLLNERIASDRDPSITMLNIVEQLLTPDDVPAYTAVLMDKVKTREAPRHFHDPPVDCPDSIAGRSSQLHATFLRPGR